MVEQIAGDFQTELDRIGWWCNEAEALINPTKAAVTWFALFSQYTNAKCKSVLFVERTHVLKYGVWFDWSLSFREHIGYVVLKALKGLGAMKIMAVAD